MGEGIIEYLWYIVPGFIIILPLIFTNKLIDLFKDGTSLLILSFVLGFFIHQIYRLVYYNCIFGKRYPIKKFKECMEIKSKDKFKIDALYNYYFWCNKELENHYQSIKKRQFYFSCLVTTLISLIIGILIIIIPIFLKITLISLFVATYFIFSIICCIVLLYVYEDMHSKEEIIILKNYQKIKSTQSI